MSYNSQIETREIADSDLDSVAGGAAGLTLQNNQGHLAGEGGAELAGHSLIAGGDANLNSGQASLTITAA